MFGVPTRKDKVKKIEEITNEETIEWLLEKENPSVRYLTLTKLLHRSENDGEVSEAKTDIMNIGIVPKILSKQNKIGFWGDPDKFYTAKYTGTVWQTMILAELGADGSNSQIRNACGFILDNSQDPESYGFSYTKSAKTGGGLHSGVVPCLSGNMVWSLIKLGYLDDSRVKNGIDWICKYQRCDDGIAEVPEGWPYDRYEMCWGKHSCHLGVVKSLKALSAIPEEKRNPEIEEKIKNLAEYMLIHHIHRKSHDLGSISRPGWLKLGFPLMYQSDILEIAGILTELGYHDPRMNEAVDIIKAKQNPEKRWKLENSFNGKMIENVETKGKNSKWITFKALNILSRY
jgi:hypothetical protein